MNNWESCIASRLLEEVTLIEMSSNNMPQILIKGFYLHDRHYSHWHRNLGIYNNKIYQLQKISKCVYDKIIKEKILSILN